MKINFSLSNLSLKRKIWVCAALISLMPLIVLFYYFSGYAVSVWAVAILSFIILLGWLTVFEVFKSVIKIYARSRAALRNIGEETPIVADEVQSLESVINLLSDKVKNSFERLQDFTRMTGELNKEVSKKVLILSTILQANDLFSRETPAEEVIKFINQHLKQLLGVKICFCSLKESALGPLKVVACEGAASLVINEFIEKRKAEFSRMRKIGIFDEKNKTAALSGWARDLGITSLVAAPVFSKGQVVGMVGAGNGEEGSFFSKEDLDVLNLFSQNVTLIWEHERLSTKVEDLEIMDDLTGLFNERMIMKRIDEEIKRSMAYQRPCAVAVMRIEGYTKYQKQAGFIEAEKLLKKAAKAFKSALRPIDIAGRIGPDVLAAILIENNKRQSKETAAAIEAKVKEVCPDKIQLVFATASSPVDGVSAQELIQAAK